MREESCLLLPGHRYERLLAGSNEGQVRKPLLSSEENIRRLARILTGEYGPFPTLFVGHGSTHPAGAPVYGKLADALHEAGFAAACLGVLAGTPGFHETADRLLANGVRTLRMVPLMLGSGRHVKEDIFGEQGGSWYSRLKALGIEVVPVRRSLLSLPAVQAMFEDPALDP